MRKDILIMTTKAKSAHLASCLSCVDIIATIYSNFKIKNNENRFILSKGHAALALYSVLYRNKIISKKLFESFCKKGSILEEHPSSKLKGIECSTGSLGHGLSFGNGLAISYKLKKKTQKIFVLLSDGECNEGATWEGFMFASAKKLGNLFVLIDFNKWQATDRSLNVLHLQNLREKLKNFGWNTYELDGHNSKLIKRILKTRITSKPVAIVCNTVKGKGVDFMEDDNNWHYRIPTILELKKAIKTL